MLQSTAVASCSIASCPCFTVKLTQVWNPEDSEDEVLVMVCRTGLNTLMGSNIRELLAPAKVINQKDLVVTVRLHAERMHVCFPCLMFWIFLDLSESFVMVKQFCFVERSLTCYVIHSVACQQLTHLPSVVCLNFHLFNCPPPGYHSCCAVTFLLSTSC